MYRYYLSILSLLLCFSVQADHHTLLQQSENFLHDLTQYVDSGIYQRELEHKCQDAKAYLSRRMKQKGLGRFAIILDIDDTALSNYPNLKRNHFSTNMEAFAAAYMLADLPANQPVLDLYQYAIDNGATVFFITGRPDTPEISMATVKNLKLAGFSTWEKLYLKPLNNPHLNTQAYKTKAREDIAKQGYDILLNMGDQKSDLEGGFSEVAILLPNPFYLNKS